MNGTGNFARCWGTHLAGSVVGATLFAALAPSAWAQAPSRPGVSPPGDAEIVSRLTGDGKGKLSVKTTEGKSGEFVWNASEQTWYFQRGYVVQRAGNLPGKADATLEVGGLAVYRFVGGRWQHQRDLVTYNKYHGLPQPDDETLLAIVRATPERAMASDWHQVVGGFKDLKIDPGRQVVWHSEHSFSFPVVASYVLKWDAVHPVDCTRQWNVRVYRQPDGKWGNPSGTKFGNAAACRG